MAPDLLDGPIADEPPPRGFTSGAGKRAVKRRAIWIGAALAAIQIVVPLGFMVAMIAAVLEAGGAPSIDVSQGAFWQGSLWLVERPSGILGPGRGGEAARVLRWSPAKGGAPQYAKLPAVEDPSLVAAGGALWVIGRDRCVVMTRDRLDAVAVAPRLERYISHSFEIDGRPAVVAATGWTGKPALYALDRGGVWTPDARVDVGSETDGPFVHPTMIVPDAGRLRVFTVDDGGIAHLPGAEGFTDLPLARWEALPAGEGALTAWTVGRVGTGIAAFTARRVGLSLAVDVTRLGPEGIWTPPAELDLGDVADLSVYGKGVGERFYLVVKTGDGGVTVHEFAGTEVVASTQLTAGAMEPVKRLNSVSAWTTVISTTVTPIILLLALAGALRRHRVDLVELAGRRIRLAPLPRRCAAGAIDSAIAAGPLAAAYALFLFSFSGDGASGEVSHVLAWLGASSLWSLVALLALAAVEGRTGLTPGNWACGIRTLGIDLGFPGFGRALLRNFLVVIDAAFGFALAIVLIALTPNQQRLGDLAARTVVVFPPRNRG